MTSLQARTIAHAAATIAGAALAAAEAVAGIIHTYWPTVNTSGASLQLLAAGGAIATASSLIDSRWSVAQLSAGALVGSAVTAAPAPAGGVGTDAPVNP